MGTISPANARALLHLSQKAPSILAKTRSANKPFPWSLFGAADTPETWAELEHLFHACLRTGDDQSAQICLDRLTGRFGEKNERVMAMRGLYQEAVADDEATLVKILKNYNEILSENPMNLPVHKRRLALLRSMGNSQEATAHLCEVIEAFPTDPELWCELSDLYQSAGMGPQAIFCLEEGLLVIPHAWNLHARLGELEYMVSQATSDNVESQKHLHQAIQRFCRSIELCTDYIRGYCGLKLATAKLLQAPKQSKASDPSMISADKAQKLNDLATSKLVHLIKVRSKNTASGFPPGDVIAAQMLLDGKFP